MKSIKLIICILLIIFFITGCNKKKRDINSSKEKKDTLQSISIEKDIDCKDELNLYYTDLENNKYYTVCLSKIILKYDDKEVELKEALDKDLRIIGEVLNKLKTADVIYDGGTTIYKDNENIDFIVIKCNSMYTDLEGEMTVKYNKDYYFGDKNLEYKDEYCKFED